MIKPKRLLQPTPHFEKALERYVWRNAKRQKCIVETIARMEADLYEPKLKTHALSGALAGFYASSCGYDCRIVFSIVEDKKSGIEKIVLVNVGTHDEVY